MGTHKDTLHGTLELLVLRTLADAGAMHGTDISDRIAQTSGDILRVEEGSLYPALHRMEDAGWVKSQWKASNNNRRARYYTVTAGGRRRLAQIERRWTAHIDAVMRVLRPA